MPNEIIWPFCKTFLKMIKLKICDLHYDFYLFPNQMLHKNYI